MSPAPKSGFELSPATQDTFHTIPHVDAPVSRADALALPACEDPHAVLLYTRTQTAVRHLSRAALTDSTDQPPAAISSPLSAEETVPDTVTAQEHVGSHADEPSIEPNADDTTVPEPQTPQEEEPEPPLSPSAESSAGNVPPTKPPTTPRATASAPEPEPRPKPEPSPSGPERLKLPPLRFMLERNDRRALAEAEKIAAAEAQLAESHMSPWDVLNSRLESGTDPYADLFEEPDGVLPPGTTIREHIESRLEGVEHRLAIDIGGDGSALFRGFSHGFFEETAGMALFDSRKVFRDSGAVIRADDARGHRVLEANIMTDEAFQKLDDWLAGRPLSVVLSRPYGHGGGVKTIPDNPYAIANVTAKLYERLGEQGMIIAQIPPGVPDRELLEWKEYIGAAVPQLEVQLGRDYWGVRGARIEKRGDAPQKLVLLPARTMMEIRNEQRIPPPPRPPLGRPRRPT